MAVSVAESLPVSILRDWINLACGKKLGEGIGRQVYVYDLNPTLVIKIETSGFQNIIEWEMWHATASTKHRKWFAPCKHITGNGTVLLMQRTLPAPRAKYPKRMPVFLGDYKYSNYGLIGSQLVCHDYGSAVIATNGLSDTMRKANWWDALDGSTFHNSERGA